MLEIVVFINIYFDDRLAMKTYSDIVLSEKKIINDINSKEKIIFSLINNNFGENVFRNIR